VRDEPEGFDRCKANQWDHHDDCISYVYIHTMYGGELNRKLVLVHLVLVFHDSCFRMFGRSCGMKLHDGLNAPTGIARRCWTLEAFK
jgi:hypothetical protein